MKARERCVCWPAAVRHAVGHRRLLQGHMEPYLQIVADLNKRVPLFVGLLLICTEVFTANLRHA